jgi:ketosteroid isomerase-like protein
MFARVTKSTRATFGRALLACAALGLSASAQSADTVRSVPTMATLLDRAQIEQMLVDYYAQLGAGRHDFGAYYVDDGTIDVNGLTAQGQKGIEELYKKVAAGTPRRPGTFRMLLTNLKITVNGDTATADAIWTGINSADVKSAPQFVEQGREHDELVKRNGRWLFKHRLITSDGGLPAMFEKTYQKR